MPRSISDTSIDDLAAERGITTFDTALPQDWFESVNRFTGKNPAGHIVWVYDTSLMGQPQAVDYIGDQIIGAYASVVRS